MSEPIPTTPPSGFRDHLPDACALRASAIETISRVYRAHGFHQIATSAVEDLAVLLGKGGGENEKLIFKIMKRGEKLEAAKTAGEELADMGLRFDLTLPLARFYSRNGSTLPYPLKAFHIGPVWRAERAQKGRYREFYQCDADIIGTDFGGAEVEVITAILAAFNELGVPDVEVVLNDRSYVYEALDHAGVAPEKRAAACVVIDKLDKVERAKILQELIELIGNNAVTDLQQTLLSTVFNRNVSLPSGHFLGEKQVVNLDCIVEAVKNAPGASSVRIDPSLMRGFDYYTGPVFEFRQPSFKGSIGGGGRYDHLTEKFGTKTVPACGGSIGFERLLLILEEQGAGKLREGKRVCLLVSDESLRGHMLELARRLRRASVPGLVVDVFPGEAKPRLDAQSKYAKTTGADAAVIVGKDEAASDLVKRRDLKTGDEKVLTFEDFLASLSAA